MSKELSQFDQLKADVILLVAPATSIRVIDVASGQKAVESAKMVKELLGRLEDKRTELVAPLNEQVKNVNAYAKEIAFPLQQAQAHIKAQLAAYDDIQAKARQKAMDEERERKAAEDRRAAEEIARIEAEFAAKAEAERKALAEESVNDEEGAALLAMFGVSDTSEEDRRKALEEKLARERAEQMAKAETDAKIRAAESKQREWDINATRVKGTKRPWKCEATDLSKVPREYLNVQLNTTAILAMKRANPALEITGVRMWQETQINIGATTSVKSLAQQTGGQHG